MAKKETPSLAAFAVQAEAQADPLTVCQITHPDAINGSVHEGARSGIRLIKGDTVSALLSDGTVI